MRQKVEQFTVRTSKRGFYEITGELAERVREFDCQSGLVTVHLQHTSASLVIQENADPEVRRDFERFFARLAPDGDPLFEHDAEGPDDMPAHIRTALTAVNLSIPVLSGRMALGTWQGVYLWEHRTQGHQRRIALHLLGE